MLFASELTSRIDIQSPTLVNTNGEATETWATIARHVPAQIVPRESMTTKQAAGVKSMTSHLVRMRYREDVTSQCRLVRGTRYLNILGPPRRVPEARPEELVMECVEVEG